MTAALAHPDSRSRSVGTAVPRFRWYPVPAAEPTGRVRAGAAVLVIGGLPATRERVCRRLVEQGLRASAPDLAGEDASDELQDRTAAALGEIGPVDGIIDLGVEQPFALSDPGPWQAALRQTVAVLKTVYDDWSAETDATRLFYLAVTRLGGRMGYDGSAVAQPLGGIWAGLAKSLPQELPNCRVKVVDLDADADAAPYVLRELVAWDLFEIGWRADCRFTLAAEQRAVGAPQLDLGPADTVLLSGGGRGLGFALARELAARFGCRVLVSGRHALPRGDEDWARLTDAEFDRQERDRLRSLPVGTTIREVRAETGSRRVRREALCNIEQACRDGLAIEYHSGDVTDPAFARALVEAAGLGLRVVIHNAGVASPTRLRNKSVESFIATVHTKVAGFVALVEALRGRRIDYFCNVGSVSGRLGGMIGQIDYAAANEVLTRLGFWACSQGQPVATICWPTWQQLGLIANFDAALRYADALAVDDGVAHWIDEIAAAEPGEVMVLGRIGRAVSPSQLTGFAKFRDHPDTRRLQSLKHYLGEVEEYAPFRSMRSRTMLPAGAHPCFAEFQVAGAPAVPVSVALEYALSAGDWVVPEGLPELWLHELRDVVVRLPRLGFGTGGLDLVKVAIGRRDGTAWEVELALTDGAGQAVLTAVARYGEAPPVPRAGAVPRLAPGPAHPVGGSGANLDWAGVLYRPACWRRGDGGHLVGRVDPVSSADEWTLPAPPAVRLPHSAIENGLRAAAAHRGRPTGELRIAVVEFGAPLDSIAPVDVVGSPDFEDWQITHDPDWTVLALTGLVLA